MSTTTTMKKTATKRYLLAGLTAALGFAAFTETAQAQEILLTGPLAGAPAVRKLRLYRQSRFELGIGATFPVLDEYKRVILIGGQLNYNLTDWLAIGVYGGFGAIPIELGLTEKIQANNPQNPNVQRSTLDERMTAVNLGPDFTKQLGTVNYILAPQVTAVPFRGKLALFNSIYTDTEIFFFAGLAFIGLTERENCTKPDQPDTACANPSASNYFTTASRMALAPTFGLGLNFFVNKWNALGLEYRFLPFAWNTGGFDTAGGGRDNDFPDGQITSADRQFKFNMMGTVRWNFYLPTGLRTSE